MVGIIHKFLLHFSFVVAKIALEAENVLELLVCISACTKFSEEMTLASARKKLWLVKFRHGG